MFKTVNVLFRRNIALITLVAGSVFLSNAQPPEYAIDGTTGTPLGGIGSGAIKFCSHNGTFAGTWRTPCALDDFKTEAMPSTQFQFFSQKGSSTPVTVPKLSAVLTGGRADDDAVYPIQTANFGKTNDVSVRMTAFCPWDLPNDKLMSYPYAFFQFSVSNTGSADVTVAVAFQASMGSPVFVAEKGITGTDGSLKRAVYVASDDPTVKITAGNDNGFMTNGECNNTVSGTVNKVAAKVTLAAGQTKLIKFVYAWYNDVKGDEGQKDGMFYYMNDFTDAGAVAAKGLENFDKFRNNALGFVGRIRGSNLPSWIKNQTLASLSNLTNNSMYRKDGRYAHTEGQWSTNGTMDQMFHSRYIFANILPSLNWNELRYWARTQKTNPAGQIHHDVDSCSDIADYKLSRNMAYMCPWDAQQHQDYRDIDKWMDLNAVYILSVYEAFIQTGDTAQLSYFWPSVDKAGKRLITQLTEDNRGSEKYPYLFSKGTQNTYDADGTNDMSAYNNSIGIPAFKSLAILAGLKNDATQQALYTKYYDSMRVSFPKYYFTSLNFPQLRTENIATGLWESFFVKFGEQVDSAKLVYMIGELRKKYDPIGGGLGYESGSYNEWSEYLVAHFGGVCLQTGFSSEWQGLQKDWYNRIFDNRNLVYNTELGIPQKVATPKYIATSYSGFNQYISAPVLWRLYYTIAGYFRNKSTNELWLEPIIPSTFNTTMDHKLSGATVFSPEGPATIDFRESGTGFKVQEIIFKTDNPITVTNLYVKDRGLATNYVKINGVAVDNAKIQKVGTGFDKKLKISFNSDISSTLTISVSDDPNFIMSLPVIHKVQQVKIANQPVFTTYRNGITIVTPASRSYSISITGLNGKTIQQYHGVGSQTYQIGTTQLNGNRLSSGVYVVKVMIDNMVYSKRFAFSR